MGRYISKRILLMIPVLLGVTILIFTLMYFVPGDVAAIVLGSSSTDVQREAYRESMGLNEPYIIQLFQYIKNIVTKLDFGTSYIQGISVTTALLERFPEH